MALKGQMSRTFLHAGILALDISLLFILSFPEGPGQVHGRFSSYRGAAAESILTDADPLVRGLLIRNEVDLPVVQQPKGDTNFVSAEDDVVTQFASASPYGNIGLLAHNYLSGRSFSKLDLGQELTLVYEGGKTETFVVTQILQYQALDPKNPYSSFQNIDDENEVLTVSQMFDRAYQGDRHLTLQTCIAAEGITSWGRLFVIASPKSAYLSTDSYSLQRLP